MRKRQQSGRRPRTRRAVGQGLERLEDRKLLSANLSRGLWLVQGDERRGPVNDVIVVDRDPSQPSLLRATLNGRVIGTAPESAVRTIRVVSGRGDDTVSVDESRGAIKVPMQILGGPGNDRLTGGSGNDQVRGDAGDDTLNGGAGNDLLLGVAGNDLLIGGLGDDVLDGGAGDDAADASQGRDTVRSARARDAVATTRFVTETALRQYLASALARRGQALGPIRNGMGGAITSSPAPGPGSIARDHSGTNVQVEGVDEADIVETDGTFVYALAGEKLTVVRAVPAETMAVLATASVSGQPVGMYLDGDRLAVLSSRWTPTNPSSPSPPAGGDRMGTWAPGRQETVLTVFDVTDPTAPKVVRETALDGWSVDSRVVDGKLVLVLQNDLFVAAGPPVWMLRGGAATTMAPGSWGGSTADFRRLPIDRVLPSYRGFVVSPTGVKTSQSGLISRAGEVLRPQSEGDGNLISVLVFDLHGTTSGPEAAASVVGSYASTVYATADTITLFTPRWEGESSTTAIQQFRFDGAGVKLIATGAVSGTPINAFAADQVGDTLRVATTTGWGTSATSAVTVLKREGDRLVTAGAVTGLAPGETIQSVRYVGDRAYVVTFLQVDPLFVIDLADPTAPRVAGELKLPGFSRYLHPLGGDRLLGIGRDADPETGRTKGIQLTLFDVAGPGNPKLVGTQTVTPPDGSSWRWSDAEWDHHAFSYFPELGLVAVPVQGGTMEATPGGEPSWRASSELMLYQVNPNTGFTPMGVVQHDSPVLRSLRIEDVIYSVAIGDLKATRLTGGGPSTVGAVSLPVPDPTPGPGPAVPV